MSHTTTENRPSTPPGTLAGRSLPRYEDVRPPPAGAAQQHSTKRIADARPPRGLRHRGPVVTRPGPEPACAVRPYPVPRPAPGRHRSDRPCPITYTRPALAASRTAIASATCRLTSNGPNVVDGARPRCWYPQGTFELGRQRRGVNGQAGLAVQVSTGAPSPASHPAMPPSGTGPGTRQAGVSPAALPRSGRYPRCPGNRRSCRHGT
jgi:hypothetical protein